MSASPYICLLPCLLIYVCMCSGPNVGLIFGVCILHALLVNVCLSTYGIRTCLLLHVCLPVGFYICRTIVSACQFEIDSMLACRWHPSFYMSRAKCACVLIRLSGYPLHYICMDVFVSLYRIICLLVTWVHHLISHVTCVHLLYACLCLYLSPLI